MSRHNILLLAETLHIGGLEVVITDLFRELDKTKFNVYVAHLKERGCIGEQLQEEGCDVLAMPERQFLKSQYLRFLRLRQVVREYKIDLIHSHSTATLIDGAFCRLITPGVKLLHTFHFGNYPHMDKKYLFMERLFSRVADLLVCVGSQQRLAVQATFKCPDSKLRTVLNGVRPVIPEMSALTDLSLGQNRIVISTIATLIEQKNISGLMRVAEKLRRLRENFVFVVAGDGPLRSQLEEERRRRNLEQHVFFLGWVQDASNCILPYVDIFFQPSLWEAMSIVVLEAASARKPMVITDVGENRNIVENGRNGYLVNPEDEDGMVRALEQLISDREMRERFGQESYELYEAHYTSRKMADNYGELYTKLLSGK